MPNVAVAAVADGVQFSATNVHAAVSFSLAGLHNHNKHLNGAVEGTVSINIVVTPKYEVQRLCPHSLLPF